eukprot:gene20196-28576_t
MTDLVSGQTWTYHALHDRVLRLASVFLATGAQDGARVAVLVVVLVVVALSALFGWLLRCSIVLPLRQASEAAAVVARGDLTVRMQTQRTDEIGQLLTALDKMVESLHYVVTEVRDSGESIHVASSEVAAGNTDLSMRTEHAASNL